VATLLFPAGVLTLGVTMLVAHARSWRRARARTTAANDLAFRHGQFRRRMQASSLLAMVGPTMLVGLQVPPDRSPRVYVALWFTVLLATCWIGWLALVDAVASARHFRRLSRERAAARAKLKSELNRILADAQKRPADAMIDVPPQRT